MSTMYSIVSSLIVCVILAGAANNASANTSAKSKGCLTLKPAITLTSTTTIKASDHVAATKKKDHKKKSPVTSLAYQPQRWKPASYIRNSYDYNHCHSHYQGSRYFRNVSPGVVGFVG